jgi:hypothetical protein
VIVRCAAHCPSEIPLESPSCFSNLVFFQFGKGLRFELRNPVSNSFTGVRGLSSLLLGWC